MADSSAVDAAIIARLSGDSALMTLVPGGVYFGDAPQGKTTFLLVSLVTAFDTGQFAATAPRRLQEDIVYTVKAVLMGSVVDPAIDAAARIDALLEDQPLTIPGYGWMSTARLERIRDTEVDSVDATIRWQHHGGRYRVLVTPTGV